MKSNYSEELDMGVLKFLEKESLREIYFVAISLLLAFGVLQTTGTALQTDQPVVSVVSCSMYPQLHVGDVLVVQGEQYRDVEVGDIVVFTVKQAEVTVDGTEHQLNSYSEGDTAAGSMKVVQVQKNRQNQAVQAVIEVDGQQITVLEGRSYEVNGQTVEVKEVMGDSIPIVHRVIEKNPDYVQTQGDNNNRQLEFEKRVAREQIHGEVLFMVPRIGGLKLVAMDLIGFSGDRPLVIDTYPRCTVENEYKPGEYRNSS